MVSIVVKDVVVVIVIEVFKPVGKANVDDLRHLLFCCEAMNILYGRNRFNFFLNNTFHLKKSIIGV